ncbi:MAG: hypothetical protein IJE78_05065 [Bacteroidaceae bacterium]|nr:hypothetical protein [Bacteroidaceae bacterium]
MYPYSTYCYMCTRQGTTKCLSCSNRTSPDGTKMRDSITDARFDLYDSLYTVHPTNMGHRVYGEDVTITPSEHLDYVLGVDQNHSEAKKEDKKMNNFMNGMFGKVAPGMCRLSMSGGIAVKTSGGDYKSYNLKTGRLTNCSNFVFDIGEDFFFVVPTNKVEKGDIILVSGKPRCVICVEDNKITVINYDDSTVDTILPERHVFMGSTYFYGKIISMFGNDVFKGVKGTNRILKYMMMSEMMKGGNGNNNFGNMLPFMLMGGGNFENMFSGMFDFDEPAGDAEDDDEDGDA